MSLWYCIGIIVGIIAGLASVALLAAIAKKLGGKISMRRSRKCKEYDERQLVVRSKAYKFAFFTLMIYTVLVQFINDIFEVSLLSSFGGAWIGVCISITVFVVYCVVNDAYISLNENKRGILILFGGIALLNLVISLSGVLSKEIDFLDEVQIMKDGVLTTHSVISIETANLSCAIMFIIICVAIVIKAFVEEREESMDEE